MADSFVLALAEREGGTVISTDHHEFDAIENAGVLPCSLQNIVKIVFISLELTQIDTLYTPPYVFPGCHDLSRSL